jgi:hypothetical protein
LLGSGFERWTFLFLWVPELPSASAPSFSQQQLTTTESQQLFNSLTEQLSHSATNYSAYDISVRTAQKTPFHYCRAIVAVKTFFFMKPLLSNACCMVVSFAVVA